MFFISAAAQKNSTKKITAEPVIPKENAKTACDCKDAVKININKTTTYGLTQPPVGFGSIQEITAKNKSDKSAFEEEHNSAWYLLDINYSGELVFDIIPQDSSNDYDFLLYKYTDSTFCEALQKKLLNPIRSNLSRVSVQTKGLTGLSSLVTNEFSGQGINAAYSKSIEVLKGQKYVLVLDNVYPEGKGHTIKFNFVKQAAIAGIIVGTDNQPVKAEISLTDFSGTIVTQANSGIDGRYKFNASLNEDQDYSLTFSSDSSFIAVKTLNTKDLKQTNTFTDIRTILPKLKKGEKYKMGTINFYGNQSDLLPESYSSVNALYMLMKKNKKMVIRIEGHVNPAYPKDDWQSLSEGRAKAVLFYLKQKGIEKERMSSIGFGASKAIYPIPKNESEGAANRRVEINVISIK